MPDPVTGRAASSRRTLEHGPTAITESHAMGKTLLDRLAATLIAVSLLAAGQAAAQQVPIHDLGTLGGTFGEAWAINNRGQVVGSSRTVANQTHPFLWTIEDGMEDLGTLGGDDGGAVEINDLGQVVGWSETADGDTHAFLWSREGGMVDLGTPAGRTSEASDINNRGEVVGQIRMGNPDSAVTPFFWSPDSGIIDLEITLSHFRFQRHRAGKDVAINDAGQVAFGPPGSERNGNLWTEAGGLVEIESLGGGRSTPLAINNLGQVTGSSTTASQLSHPFVWSEQGGIVDLGTLGGLSADAGAINDRGEVAGASQTTIAAQWHPFFWSAAEGLADLGPLLDGRSFGLDINELGHVVGFGEFAPQLPQQALLWTQEDGLVDLGTLGGPNSEAWAINDFDQIVGSSATSSGERHAALWGETRIADLWLDQSVRRVGGGTVRLTVTVHSAAGCRVAEPEVCGFGATAEAENVLVIDRLPLSPGKLEVVSLPSRCSYARGAHTVTCSAPLLPRDTSVALAIEVRLRGAAGGDLVNTATVTSDTFDPNPENNTVELVRLRPAPISANE